MFGVRKGLAEEDPGSFIKRSINETHPLYNHPKCVDSAPIQKVKIEDEGDAKVYAEPIECPTV